MNLWSPFVQRFSVARRNQQGDKILEVGESVTWLSWRHYVTYWNTDHIYFIGSLSLSPVWWTAMGRELGFDMLSCHDGNISFLNKVVSSEMLPFISQNRHFLVIGCSQNPYQVTAHVRSSSRVNVFCVVSRTQVYDLFFPRRYRYWPFVCVPTHWGTSCSAFGCKQTLQRRDAVPEHSLSRNVDKSWWRHSMAIKIIRSDVSGLCFWTFVKDTELHGISRASRKGC